MTTWPAARGGGGRLKWSQPVPAGEAETEAAAGGSGRSTGGRGSLGKGEGERGGGRQARGAPPTAAPAPRRGDPRRARQQRRAPRWQRRGARGSVRGGRKGRPPPWRGREWKKGPPCVRVTGAAASPRTRTAFPPTRHRRWEHRPLDACQRDNAARLTITNQIVLRVRRKSRGGAASFAPPPDSLTDIALRGVAAACWTHCQPPSGRRHAHTRAWVHAAPEGATSTATPPSRVGRCGRRPLTPPPGGG